MMMNLPVLTCCLLILMSLSSVHAKDSLHIVKYPDGSKTFKLISKRDTFLMSTYPNGRRESRLTLKNGIVNGSYIRWYPNGKLMWKKQMVNSVPNGTAEFFDQKGIKVAVLNYTKGRITDTVFIFKNRHLLFGKITYSSKVVGGAVREDGQANVSEHSGLYKQCDMYAVKTDIRNKPRFISNFRSDEYGEFFILVPEGKLGFYPKSIKIETLGPGNYDPPQVMWNSGHDGWTVKGALEVKQGDKLLFVELHHASLGYAP